MAVAANPARAADSAAARVDTPAISTRVGARITDMKCKHLSDPEARSRGGGRDRVQMIEDGPARLTNAEGLDDRRRAAAGEAVRDERRALGAVFGNCRQA